MARIADFGQLELVANSGRRRLAIPYADILTAEHLPQAWRGLRLHVRSGGSIRLRCWGAKRVAVEDELRRRGVRIVDEYGAMITPTFTDFEDELVKEPMRVRQSSDDA